MTDVLIIYRNLQAASPDVSHVGLGVNSLHTVKCLRASGIACDVVGIRNLADLNTIIASRPMTSHVVIEAPFLSGHDVLSFCMSHSRIEICCRVHSQVAFLQVEAGAIKLIRDYISIQDHTPNFHLAVNAARSTEFITQAYHAAPVLLPNLYFPVHAGRKSHRVPTSLVKIGSFGAIRLLKNHITAAAASLMLASLNRLNLEFFISVNREENGKGVVQAIRNLFDDVPYASLIEVPWKSWSDFRRLIASVDLHMQLSATESFNLTCADAVDAGVPSVIGEAIDWLPPSWVAPIDDAEAVARKGWSLLCDPHVIEDGRKALVVFNSDSMTKWKKWIGVS